MNRDNISNYHISAQMVNLVDRKVTTAISYAQCFIFILPPPSINNWTF